MSDLDREVRILAALHALQEVVVFAVDVGVVADFPIVSGAFGFHESCDVASFAEAIRVGTPKGSQRLSLMK